MTKIKYSQQAEIFTIILEKEYPNIRKEINEWFIENKMTIGGAHMLEFMKSNKDLRKLLKEARQNGGD